MHALFIHGMGRTPLSGWRLLRKLRTGGIHTRSFGYSTAIQNFAQISTRLAARITQLAAEGDYILIGHSLGGVLLRAALALLPAGTRPPCHVFLLGSPIQPARLAILLGRNPIYRILTGDCGQLLGSHERMQHIPPITASTTGIAGQRSLFITRPLFQGEVNDGVVSVAETAAPWISDTLTLPVAHTFLPASERIAAIVLERLRATA